MQHHTTTPPATEPVTLADLRLHLGIGQTDDTARDAIITGRIVTARIMAEKYTNTALISQTWTAYGRVFDPVIPLKSPLQSVASVKYIDSNGTLQTLDTAAYEIDRVSNIVVPAYGQAWPIPRDSVNSVQVEYVCGYGNASDVPAPIVDAIKYIVGWLEGYQASIEGNGPLMGMPRAAQQLLDPFKDYRDIV